MKTLRIILCLCGILFRQFLMGQFDSTTSSLTPAGPLRGFHAGIVQPILSVHKGNLNWHDRFDLYSIGFPFGFTLNTGGRLLFDFELVPFVQPFLLSEQSYQVHLLIHPGVLLPLTKGWTLGLRAAFEAGANQFGFTPLLNKGFKIKSGQVLYIELVLPARFGPQKEACYTQVAGLHVGIGF
ncbi:MAG: hypothetical protein IPM48_00430 [Saprospiraceae bacterium]|nr:hypothetical protein [Saprospiraceae bacterium]